MTEDPGTNPIQQAIYEIADTLSTEKNIMIKNLSLSKLYQQSQFVHHNQYSSLW